MGFKIKPGTPEKLQSISLTHFSERKQAPLPLLNFAFDETIKVEIIKEIGFMVYLTDMAESMSLMKVLC